MAVASGRFAAPAIPAPSSRWRGRPAQVAGVVGLMLLAFAFLRGEAPWPSSLIWNELPAKLDSAQSWLLEQRTAEDPNFIFAILDGFRAFADWLVTTANDAMLWMTWVGTLAASVLIVLRFGGWRAALIVFAAYASFALMGLWEESVQTLALMFAAVLLSLGIGMPLGVAAGRSQRVHRTITPALDAMQIVPAFAYLMPVVILFSVGPAAAVICTMIYAVPPAVRITALGIRGVTADTVEASRAYGATGLQTLFKVQLPLARRQLLLSVNQTIMFALSLVVIAGLIGGRGLGDVVTSGLYSNASLALLAGAAIVIMAIALDRATAAIADRTDPTRRHLDDEGRRRARISTLVTFAAIVAIVLIARALGVAESYPDEFETSTTIFTATIQDTLLELDPVGARLRAGPVVVHLRHHRADRELPRQVRARAAARAARRDAVVRHRARALRDRLPDERPAPGGHRAADADGDRRDGRLGAGDGHRVAGARGDRAGRRDRHRRRGLGGGEPARGEAAAAAARHAADAAAARLHHPVHLPDAGLPRPGRRRLCALRGAGRDPAGDLRACAACRRPPSRRLPRSARRAGRCS